MGSKLHVRDIRSGPPLHYKDDVRAYSKEYAHSLDEQDSLRHFRDEFIIPSKKDLKRKTLAVTEGNVHGAAVETYTRCRSSPIEATRTEY